MNSEIDILRKTLARERKARKLAESLLETRSRELFRTNLELEDSYAATVEVFSNLFGARSGRSPESLRRLGRETKAFASHIGLTTEQQRNLYLAAMLCDLGKLAIADELLLKPLMDLSSAEKQQFVRHPLLAHESLIALPPLEIAAEIVLQHCEHFDGGGYPQGLSWVDTSIESHVLCLSKDFDGLTQGKIVRGELTSQEAVKFIDGHKGDRYEPKLADTFIEFVKTQHEQLGNLSEQRLAPGSLKPGMILTRDLKNDEGVLILPAGRRLSDTMIKKLAAISQRRQSDVMLYIETNSQSAALK
ncbi:MAG: HD-GYP domain-containing protein [Pseudomonadales bacterium]